MSENIYEALKYAVELSEREETIISDADGKEYYDLNKFTLKELDPMKYPNSIELSSLTSLIDYLQNKVDDDSFNESTLIVHVESHKHVSLFTELDTEQRRRKFAVVKADVAEIDFGRYYDSESFNVLLASSFKQTENNRELLKIASHIKIEQGAEVSDDGVSQVATVKKGAGTLAKGKLPNPVELQPYRTFQEVPQPTSDFIFRINERGGMALFEADGGLWKHEAKLSIADYLKEELKDIENLVVLA